MGALDAFGAAVERRIDLGLIGDRVFVNNASNGPVRQDRAVARIPGSQDRYGTRVAAGDARPERCALRPAVHGSRRHRPRFRASHPGVQQPLRARPGGRLRVPTPHRRRDPRDRRRQLPVLQRHHAVHADAAGRPDTSNPGRGPNGPTPSFELRSGGPIEVGIDGEGILLDPPLEFRILPRALRVRIPPHAPGFSPAAALPPSGWSTIAALVKTAAGRPAPFER